MPNLKTSIKDLRSTKRKTVYNDRLRKRVKKSEKNFKDNIKEGNKEKAEAYLKQTYKVLDKAAKKNVIKKGKASRGYLSCFFLEWNIWKERMQAMDLCCYTFCDILVFKKNQC